MPATPAWLASLEALLNRRIAESPRAQAVAARLHGASLRLDIEHLRAVRATVHDGHLLLEAAGETPADVTIVGGAGALIELALRFGGLSGGESAAAAPASGRTGRSAQGTGGGVRIVGDAEVAARFRELLREARPDPEEEIARLIGDTPAHALARLARAGLGWAERTRQALGADLAEYLTEERRVLVTRAELEEFLLEVDRVRESYDRLEARLAYLEARRSGSPP